MGHCWLEIFHIAASIANHLFFLAFFCLFPAKSLVHSVQPHKHTFASSDATPVQTSDDTQILKMSEQQAPVDYLHRYPAAHLCILQHICVSCSTFVPHTMCSVARLSRGPGQCPKSEDVSIKRSGFALRILNIIAIQFYNPLTMTSISHRQPLTYR